MFLFVLILRTALLDSGDGSVDYIRLATQAVQLVGYGSSPGQATESVGKEFVY